MFHNSRTPQNIHRTPERPPFIPIPSSVMLSENDSAQPSPLKPPSTCPCAHSHYIIRSQLEAISAGVVERCLRRLDRCNGACSVSSK
ncbi:hypothetical protein PROFUN_02806 [Planoprotostelium fungivorum]|uniref:Uncharacterized protein n=1 Tax=Planoprotostelium fungivorum TaxID=1890364 RepID=A0A2P6NXM3_9EUKA|nr:hypothetical protein PROFUN_02806 [Planoprotostelium fungivorum]